MRLPADLPARLRAAGLVVEEAAGWRGRGAPLSAPSLVLVHDDIIGGCPTFPPRALIDGIQQPTQYVPGPLYNLWTSCAGVVWVLADGTANNAGKGSYAGVVGNRRTVAVVRSHHPDLGPAPAVQNQAAATAARVLAEAIDVDVDRIIRHEDWTTRKKDTWNWPTPAIRAAATDEEDDLMGRGDEIVANQWREAIATARARDAEMQTEWYTRRVLADMLDQVLVDLDSDRGRLSEETTGYLAKIGNEPPKPVHERAVVAHARAALGDQAVDGILDELPAAA